MNKSDFLVELEDILQREEPCKEQDILEDYEEWDSLSKMSVMAFFNKTFGISVTLTDLKNLKTVEDLVKLAKDKIDD